MDPNNDERNLCNSLLDLDFDRVNDNFASEYDDPFQYSK
jgi:hypothetical protein